MRGLAGAALAALMPAWALACGPLPPPAPPHSLRVAVQAPAEAGEDDGPKRRGAVVDTLRDLFPALAACWESPEGLARFERTEITARLSLKSDGSLMGPPRITFARVPGDARARAILTEATLAAIRRCTPVNVTKALGGAIAGRPFALRFIYEGPKGQGV